MNVQEHIKKIIDSLNFDIPDNDIMYDLSSYDIARNIDYEKMSDKSVYNCVGYSINYNSNNKFLYINDTPICIMSYHTHGSISYHFVNEDSVKLFEQYVDYFTTPFKKDHQYIDEDFFQNIVL